MNHEEAIGGMMTEKYLLGELTGNARDAFEEHLFTCTECAQDLKACVTMMEAAIGDLAEPPAREVTPAAARPSRWREWLKPVWLAPAFAACLAVVVYQNAVQVPGLKKELAQADTPEVLNPVMLAGGAARGEGDVTAIARQGGSFLLVVDVPAVGDYDAYRCTLISPSEKTVWQQELTREQAKDSVQLRVPAAATEAGMNRLVIEGLRHENGVPAKPEPIATRTFHLVIIK